MKKTHDILTAMDRFVIASVVGTLFMLALVWVRT